MVRVTTSDRYEWLRCDLDDGHDGECQVAVRGKGFPNMLQGG